MAEYLAEASHIFGQPRGLSCEPRGLCYRPGSEATLALRHFTFYLATNRTSIR